MIKPADSPGDQPMEISGGYEAADCGYYGIDVNIARALGKKGHLGYSTENCAWEASLSDCGYYTMNRGIARALMRLAHS